ncbi:MAG: HD domain-containing protein [Cyclobacteriaceae bacterium]
MADPIKVFRDPIYNLISFNKKEDEPLIKILNTPEFQRLRRIRQLGLSGYTFPTSVHDRFSHSIGVAYLVEELYNSLNVPDSIEVITPEGDKEILNKKQLKLLLKLAGLLHDIGHGPFSHAFEKVTSVNHEEMSKKIILNANGSILPILTTIEDELLGKYSAQWICDIISGGTFSPIWAKELISSQLDADRIDYLLRDAYMCGVNYASFDIKWLFQNIEIGEIENEGNRDGLLINAKKGIHAVEAFIISRYHMYEQVYFHKTTRGFELITQKIFERLNHMLEKGNTVSFLNNNLLYFIQDNNNLDAYLTLDDFNLYTHFNHWINNCEDKILQALCESIIYRQPYKMFREVENDSLFNRSDYQRIERVFKGDESDYFYFEDEYLNVAYKDTYLLGKKTAERAEHIWLKFHTGNLKEFAEVSPVISSLKNNELRKKRAYMHRDFHEKI